MTGLYVGAPVARRRTPPEDHAHGAGIAERQRGGEPFQPRRRPAGRGGVGVIAERAPQDVDRVLQPIEERAMILRRREPGVPAVLADGARVARQPRQRLARGRRAEDRTRQAPAHPLVVGGQAQAGRRAAHPRADDGAAV